MEVVYVLVALGVFGTLTVDQVIAYGETAIAEGARPVLGDAGFVMIAIAAMLATAWSANASLYASVGLTRMLAAIAVTAVVLVFLGIDTARNDPATFVAILAIAALAVVFNLLWAHPRPASGPAVRPTEPNAPA